MRWADRSAGIQSPIPLIYLREGSGAVRSSWDSVTYPLDILVREADNVERELGFSHLSP